jgi:hypothetical protein
VRTYYLKYPQKTGKDKGTWGNTNIICRIVRPQPQWRNAHAPDSWQCEQVYPVGKTSPDACANVKTGSRGWETLFRKLDSETLLSPVLKALMSFKGYQARIPVQPVPFWQLHLWPLWFQWDRCQCDRCQVWCRNHHLVALCMGWPSMRLTRFQQ